MGAGLPSIEGTGFKILLPITFGTSSKHFGTCCKIFLNDFKYILQTIHLASNLQ